LTKFFVKPRRIGASAASSGATSVLGAAAAESVRVADSLAIPTASGTFDALATGPEEGRPVLLLHGFPECAEQWGHQLAALGRAGYRSVAFDQRGYSPGVRPLEVDAYGPEELIGDVLAVAEALGWPRFDLVGHDWGSAVAWMTAMAHPERLRTLTTVSTPHGAALSRAVREDPDQQRRSAYFALFRTPEAERELLDGGGLRPFYDGLPAERTQRYVERFSEPGALTAALNWYRAMRPPAKRGPITTPTLYVWSTADAFIGETAARGVERHVAGPYRFEVLDGISHWITEEAPERLSALMLEHLAAW
jgi:pimeloyl-ACP methyl ester carboxylesterase